MDYRGTAIVGVWIGIAAIIGIFNYTEYLAGASLWLVFAAFMLTAHIIRQSPGGEAGENRNQEISDLDKRLLTIEKSVDEIKRLLEE
ncbi:MAG: hypothetical protein ABIG39_07145 [Candidatus Micrarchaeota archaeon]